MPSKKQYNLVNDDAYDSRIPLYNEEAFQHGITFHAKYIGSLDVPRPSSRVEIVAAMRRIRYEFKAKSLKKKKISLTVSVEGVKIALRNKKKTNQWPWDESKFIIMHHPIYRIFYVSHDSQDLKIFSYIARDGGTNSFKCNVFKSKKKSQAMRIVRTIGQAFEVCHKLSLALASTSATGCTSEEAEENALHDHSSKGKSQGDGASEPNSCDTQEELTASKMSDSIAHQGAFRTNGTNLSPKNETEPKLGISNNTSQISESLSVYHHIQLLKEQLEQQNQQMQSVMGQVQLLKDQLSAETTARLEAQTQNHHLLAHNRELLEHIKRLVNHIHDVEEKFHKTGKSSDTSIPEPFLNFPSSDMDLYHQNTKSFTRNEKNSSTSIGGSIFDERNSPDSVFQKNFPSTTNRQLSVPTSSRHSSSNSPKFGVSFNQFGSSLPGSPSQLTFSSITDGLFKPNSFVCSSPKVAKKSPLSNESSNDIITQADIVRSPSFSQSSTTQGGSKSPKHQIFDFDPVASSSLFNSNNCSPSLFSDKFSPKSFSMSDQNDADFSFSGGAISRHESFNRNSKNSDPFSNDSFIAQMTRDLAKMSTLEKNLAEFGSGGKSHAESNFTSLFNS